MLPQARVVAAFPTVASEALFGVYQAKRKVRRPGVVVRGGPLLRTKLPGFAGLLTNGVWSPVPAADAQSLARVSG
jgi:hypothetical protein